MLSVLPQLRTSLKPWLRRVLLVLASVVALGMAVYAVAILAGGAFWFVLLLLRSNEGARDIFLHFLPSLGAVLFCMASASGLVIGWVTSWRWAPTFSALITIILMILTVRDYSAFVSGEDYEWSWLLLLAAMFLLPGVVVGFIQNLSRQSQIPSS